MNKGKPIANQLALQGSIFHLKAQIANLQGAGLSATQS